MAYAVWIDIAAPASTTATKDEQHQLPQLIMSLIEAGWEVTVPTAEAVADDIDDAPADRADEPPDLLDVEVLGYSGGAWVGLVVDTDLVEVALAFGTGLGRQVRNAAPALMGATVASVRADLARGPDSDGRWLALNRENRRPRFPLAEHLSSELQDLCAQYLLAGAVRYLIDPKPHSRWRIDPAEVVDGAVIDHPWDREIASALSVLLIAAGDAEAQIGVRDPLASRGEGDPALAEALLVRVRSEIAEPSDDDDRMRGLNVIEQFMDDHDLHWDHVDDDLDEDANERETRRQLRALLWAGLRALTTMTARLDASSPWLWLAAVGVDTPAVVTFAELDEDNLEYVADDTAEQITAAARAHLHIRVALMHPALLISAAPEFDRLELDDLGSARDPLHHLFIDTIGNLGVAVVEQILTSSDAPQEVVDVATVMLPTMRDVENHVEGATDHMFDPLDELLPPRSEHRDVADDVRRILVFLGHAAELAGPAVVSRTIGYLTRSPAELACVIVDDAEQDTDAVIRKHMLAMACAVNTDVAVTFAAELIAINGDDPRHAPALRHEADSWWATIVHALDHPPIREALAQAVTDCAEPGATLLRMLISPRSGDDSALALPADLSMEGAVVGVVQALTALTVSMRDPDLPFEIVIDD